MTRTSGKKHDERHRRDHDVEHATQDFDGGERDLMPRVPALRRVVRLLEENRKRGHRLDLVVRSRGANADAVPDPAVLESGTKRQFLS
jgi:hypothetical protein